MVPYEVDLYRISHDVDHMKCKFTISKLNRKQAKIIDYFAGMEDRPVKHAEFRPMPAKLLGS